METKLNNEDFYEFKKRINKFFRELRKNGYTAKQNFLCCSGCGWAEIGDVPKAVFYHKQDTPYIEEGKVYLCWSGDGSEIVRIAQECGLGVLWDGNIRTRIKLIHER